MNAVVNAHTEGDSLPTAGIWGNVDEVAYHADRGSLSVSGAKLLLRAPKLFRYRQDHPEHKDVFDFGSAAHRLVLGVGPEIKVIEADDWRTKTAREARDEARAHGAIPLLAKDHRKVQAMADELSTHTLAMRLLSEGQPEVSAYSVDEQTGVVRRGRCDWLTESIITDFKTARSAEPNEFVRSAINYGYHMQQAWYLDLFTSLGHSAEAFAFIVQEQEPPHLVTVVELPAELVEVGRARNQRALERFRDCTQSGIWPGYIPDDTFARPDSPAWALREDAA